MKVPAGIAGQAGVSGGESCHSGRALIRRPRENPMQTRGAQEPVEPR